ncbi:hypothetical protein [Streptomyces caatingaensis]|uniref:Sugar ABC transporter permease n=1 Tax=Streptomyces caatingaensis TaxID=1678637 RepID=A0A0K9XDR5_9ACTN|nr:hypothetical protein [Streptomyces caatingaensis]KNB50782.1 hypothetical protein AC230_20240 [Streptomyces caatingaensis]
MTEAAAPGFARAREAVLGRVDATAAAVGDRFPLHAGPADGRWTTTRRGSWTGGFWAGLLWIAAEASGHPADLRRARTVTARLLERAHDDTDTRAMTFWYGAAQGRLRCGDLDAARVARAGAEALAAAAHPRHGVVPAGTALGRGARGANELTVDAAAALVALLAWAGREQLARRQADMVRDRCLDPGGRVRAAVPLDGPARDTPPGEWARGQAWGVLALATAARTLPGGDYRQAALLAADHWLDRTGEAVPPWSFRDPDGPRDTSAAAIAAQALLDLAGITPGPRGDSLAGAATGLLHRLVSGHLTTTGRLLDGCYDMASGTAVAHELVWGDHFLLSALQSLAARR